MAIKYYVIVSGRIPGIYTDWPTAESMIKGFPGAIFKSFGALKDAEKFMEQSTTPKSTADKPIIVPRTLPLVDKTLVYIKGNSTPIDSNNKSCGFGIVIISKDGDKITAYGCVPLDSVANITELYAVYVTLSLVRGDIIIYTDSSYVVKCFTHYINLWIENGWNDVPNRHLIEPIYFLMKDRNISFEYVPTNSPSELNLEAGLLANKGQLSNGPLFLSKNGIPHHPSS